MNPVKPVKNLVPDPCVMVIFGATGDLTKRKLIPALCNLAKSNLLPTQFAIIAFAFDPLTTDAYRQQLSDGMREFQISPVDPKLWDWFMERTYYVQGDFQDPVAFERLSAQVTLAENEHHTHGD